MSIVIDFYKGNGSKTKNITFKSHGNGWWYFKFFRLTITKSDLDVVSELTKCLDILGKARWESPKTAARKKIRKWSVK
ncbi:MAG: hypothetical protein ACRCX7_09920 [Cetobacterium sp.]|uniref:hypothetical protein n=1 Tax=Cetobacterium sp. TaxID=2071632 RepID=UPI003F364165